jgi:hypothetical protein
MEVEGQAYQEEQTISVQEQGTDGAPLELTETAAAYLKDTGPWMSFLGIVGFVSCGIILISGLVMLALGANTPYLPNSLLMGFLYIVLAVICFFPARFMFLAGSKLRALKTDGDADLLEEALRNNKAYWKLSGIITIVGLGLAVLALIVLIIALLFGGIGTFL